MGQLRLTDDQPTVWKFCGNLRSEGDTMSYVFLPIRKAERETGEAGEAEPLTPNF